MNPERLSLVILLAGLAVIGGAYYFQYQMGLQPCELCLKERIPWYTALVATSLWATLRHGGWVDRGVDAGCVLVFALLFTVSAVLAGYHVAVEHHWVAGPDACVAQHFGNMSLADLTKTLLATPPVRCDVVQWSVVGVSLAGWNCLLSTAMIALCLTALRQRRGKRRLG